MHNLGITCPPSSWASGLWTASYGTGEVLVGPVPTLFVDTPDVAGDALRADMGKTHYDLNRLHKVFFGTEEIQLREALSLVKKPR